MTPIKGLVLKIQKGDIVTVGDDIRIAAENIGQKTTKLVIDAPRSTPIQHSGMKRKETK
jgi:sRNA-binding carbon storage regulator CsrA